MTFQNGYQQPQGGYQQGGFQPPQQGGFQNQNQNENRNSGFDNHVKIQIIGRIVSDPESKMVNNSKIAKSKIAINHRGKNSNADYWFIEVWGNEGADSIYNFLINHCGKGRRVFIEGTPHLNQTKDEQGNYNYFPTIKIDRIVGLDGGNQSDNGQQQQQSQQPTGQYNAPQGGFQQQPQQGGFQQQPPMQQSPMQQQPPQQQPQLVGAGAGAGGGAPQNGFPPNPPGGYGAPAPVGAPNTGGFPPMPPQR